MTTYRFTPSGMTHNRRFRVDSASGSASPATITTAENNVIFQSVVSSDLVGNVPMFKGTAATLYLKEIGPSDTVIGSPVTVSGTVDPGQAGPVDGGSGGGGGTTAPPERLPPVATYGYNGDGTVATETIDGVVTTFSYNVDKTVHTATRDGVTRTFAYSGGNLTGIS